MKKAIFGGTFDPLHIGHINIAFEALYLLHLDEVIFVPTGNPPHKKHITSNYHRVNMIKGTIEKYDKLSLSTYEVEKKDKSYTYETLEYFKNSEKDVEWYFIVGEDCLLDIEKWKNPDKVLGYATLVVFKRTDKNNDKLKEYKEIIEKKYDTNIILLNNKVIDISSTFIRKSINQNHEVSFLLPSFVMEYIKKFKLYEKGDTLILKEKIKSLLKDTLNTDRYNHTMRVVDEAKKLAVLYGVDEEKAEIAALTHDCAKNMSYNELREICEKGNIIFTEDDFNSKPIWHAYAAAVIAKEKFNINDEEIINAVKYHTTGRKNMTLLEKIIYLADYIEPGRTFEKIQEVRTLAYDKDIDEAMIKAINNTIEFLMSKRSIIHKSTIEARNYLIINTK